MEKNSYIKRELENFDYDKRYNTLIEHRWCYLKDPEKLKEFFDKKDENSKPKISRVQSNPETTGQHGTMI